MKALSFWKKSLYSALIFFGTLIVLLVGYATWNAAMSKVNPGNPLSATSWNALVDNIADLDSRWSRSGGNIVFTGGNVGIGVTSPAEKLDLWGGNIKIGIETVSNDCVGTSVSSCTVLCSSWKLVTWGGCIVDNSVKYVYRTYPIGNGWACATWGNLENAGSVLRAYAICANIR